MLMLFYLCFISGQRSLWLFVKRFKNNKKLDWLNFEPQFWKIKRCPALYLIKANMSFRSVEEQKPGPVPPDQARPGTQRATRGQDIFTLYKRVGMLVVQSSHQGRLHNLSKQPAVQHHAVYGAGARLRGPGPISEPTTKKRSVTRWWSVASVNSGGGLYTTYIRDDIYAVYLYMCVLI